VNRNVIIQPKPIFLNRTVIAMHLCLLRKTIKFNRFVETQAHIAHDCPLQ